MKTKFNERGITLIELLIALVISGIIVGAIYRLFVAQTRSYTVQDQVAEVQQNVRSAMEILVRDIRMAGYDNDSPVYIGGVPVYGINTPSGNLPGDRPIDPDPSAPADKNSITVFYEYGTGVRQVTYSVDASNRLIRNQIPADIGATPGGDPILENVQRFALEYGVDRDIWGNWLDDRRVHSWVAAGQTSGVNIVAVRVQLSARPDSGNPDLDRLSPRSLDSVAAVRNQMNSSRTFLLIE